MALTAGSTATAADFNNLKNRVKNEKNRRDRTTFTFSDTNVSQGGTISYSQGNNLINVLRAINTSTTNFATVSSGSPLKAIAQLQTALTTFEACPYRKADGTGSGCSSGCIGLCQSCTGDCSSGCSDSCTNGCTSCSGGCTGSCGGGCFGSCSGSCSGGCSGGCGGNYYG